MSHLPYGYRIENGVPVIDDEAANNLCSMYEAYVSGLSLTKAAETVGLKRNHAAAKHMLRNRKYLGDGFYPQIVNKDLFEQAEREIKERAKRLGRDGKPRIYKEPIIYTNFSIDYAEEQYEDPLEQAEYIYSHIRAEVPDGTGE